MLITIGKGLQLKAVKAAKNYFVYAGLIAVRCGLNEQGRSIKENRFNLAYKKQIFMNDVPEKPDGDLLMQLVKMEMPFGKYKGTLLCDLPVFYLEWFQRQGFPKGKMGILLATIYEIKINGLENLLKPLKQKK